MHRGLTSSNLHARSHRQTCRSCRRPPAIRHHTEAGNENLELVPLRAAEHRRGSPLAPIPSDPAELRVAGRPVAPLGQYDFRRGRPAHGQHQPADPAVNSTSPTGLTPEQILKAYGIAGSRSPAGRSAALERGRRSRSSMPTTIRISARISPHSTPSTACPPRRRSRWRIWARRRPTPAGRWRPHSTWNGPMPIAPGASIVLVEASSASLSALFGAVSYASKLSRASAWSR